MPRAIRSAKIEPLGPLLCSEAREPFQGIPIPSASSRRVTGPAVHMKFSACTCRGPRSSGQPWSRANFLNASTRRYPMLGSPAFLSCSAVLAATRLRWCSLERLSPRPSRRRQSPTVRRHIGAHRG